MNELTPINQNPASPATFLMEGQEFIQDLTSESASYCSFVADTTEKQMLLYSGMNDPDFRLGDIINKTINVKDVYCEIVNCTNRDTGEVTAVPRIVLFDAEGKSYQAVSIGIYSAVQKLIRAFGVPTWETPIPLVVKQINRGDRKMLTLGVAK